MFLSGNYLFNRGGEVQPRFYFLFFHPRTERSLVYTRATSSMRAYEGGNGEGGEERREMYIYIERGRERKVEWCKYFSRSPVR